MRAGPPAAAAAAAAPAPVRARLAAPAGPDSPAGADFLRGAIALLGTALVEFRWLLALDACAVATRRVLTVTASDKDDREVHRSAIRSRDGRHCMRPL